jgi:hypothetical protein
MTPRFRKYDWVFIGLALIGFAMLLLMAGCTVRGTSALVAPAVGGADLNSVLLWTVAASLLGLGVSVAAAVWLHSVLVAATGISGFGTILAAAVSLKVIQPYLGWFVLAGFVAAAIVAFFSLRHLSMAKTAAVLFGKDMTSANTDDEAAAVKATHSAIQGYLGVKGLIDKTLTKAKALAKGGK